VRPRASASCYLRTVKTTEMKHLPYVLLGSTLLVGCSSGSTGSAPPSLGTIEFIPVNTAVDLTPDGSVALLTDLGTADVYLYDTFTHDLNLVTSAGDPQHDFVTGISADFRVSANHGVPVQAGLWTAAGDWVDIGSSNSSGGCGSDVASAWDVSADGHVAVGLAWNVCDAEAIRWSDASGAGVFTPMQVLGHVPSGSTAAPTNRATVVSDDGAVAAGFAQTVRVDRWPAIWDASGAGFLIDAGGVFTSDSPGEVLSISEDGSVVAGIWALDGFVWNSTTGVVDIGRLPNSLPSDPTFPNAIAAGGQLVFGACGDPFSGVPAAFVWTAADGMRPLQDIVVASGVHLPTGTLLINVLGASADGSMLLGQAFDANFNQVSFVLDLPVSAYGL
jgi:hypothetical protein